MVTLTSGWRVSDFSSFQNERGLTTPANCVLPTLGLGVLGPAVFGLGLGDSLYVLFE